MLYIRDLKLAKKRIYIEMAYFSDNEIIKVIQNKIDIKMKSD